MELASAHLGERLAAPAVCCPVPADPEIRKLLESECQAVITALRESEARFRGAFDSAPIGMALVCTDGRWLQVNDSLCRIVGYTSDELLATDFQTITHPDDLDADLELVRQLLAGDIRDYQMEKRYLHKNGSHVWVLLSVSLVRNDCGEGLYFISQMQDITERKQAMWLESERRQILEMVARDLPLPDVLARVAHAVERAVAGSRASIMIVDNGAICLVGGDVPPAWRDAMQAGGLKLANGLSSDSWLSEHHCGVTFTTSDPVWKGWVKVARMCDVRACWTMPIQSADGASLGLVLIFAAHERRPAHAEIQTMELTARLAAICIDHHNTTRQLAHLVRHDTLTRLPNRILFEDRLQQALAFAKRHGATIAVMALDIDKFKHINDTLGHYCGDHLLQQFAQRLKSQLRESDTIARFGGDEFVIILPKVGTPDAAAIVARKLIDCLTEPFAFDEHKLIVTTSIGIALYPTDASHSVELQKKADAALYRAKEAGRNRFSF